MIGVVTAAVAFIAGAGAVVPEGVPPDAIARFVLVTVYLGQAVDVAPARVDVLAGPMTALF